MPNIFVRGQKPIKVSKEQAEKIKTLFDNNTIPASTVVSLDGISVRKEDIKYIMLSDEDDVQEKNLAKGSESVSEIEKQHQDLIDARLALTPVERAKELTEFKVLYKTMTGIEPTREELLQAAKFQLSYFKKHNWAYPNLAIFIPLIKSKLKGKLDMIDNMLLSTLKMHCDSAVGRVSRREYALSKTSHE